MKLKDLDLSNFGPGEVKQIEAAAHFAARAHRGQKRLSGEPYISHPLAVARILQGWGMDSQSLAAGLLHDVVEDTPVTLEQLEEKFGPAVAELVGGVTKLGQVDYEPAGEPSFIQTASVENLRKLLLAMTKDLRVVIIKLADRLHNLQTLRYLKPKDQERFAQESLAIFAPLADRLGMGQAKGQIEDLSFQFAYPAEYKRIERQVREQLKKAERFLARLKRFIDEQMGRQQVPVVAIEGRSKGLYSLYKKLSKVDGDIEKVYDLMAVRIIVPEEADCYKTLGLLHQHFKPLIYRIKDYIAVPKPNGYRSLHTTVFALDGHITEIQIRTPQMHEEAERGLAAHFYYDQQKNAKAYRRQEASVVPEKFKWVNNLVDLKDITSHDLVQALEVDLFKDRIFAFSPKGDLFDLPEGATPIDFAFAVHSDIGLRTQGAKINGRMVPLDTALENRDVVEILTRKLPSPSRDWLKVAKTPRAANRLRAWFRLADREQYVQQGRQLLETERKGAGLKRLEDLAKPELKRLLAELIQDSPEDVYAALGEGSLKPAQLAQKLNPPDVSSPRAAKPRSKSPAGARIAFGGGAELPYVLATCCQPAYPQPVTGYVTRGSGVSVHLTGCRNVKDEPDRLVECHWEPLG